MLINTSLFTILYFFVFFIQIYFSKSLNFDSLLNTYKTQEYYPNAYKDIANTTWKEIVVADRLINLVKCIPTFIDSDKDIDLLVLDSETKLYWVSNIRGTAGNFHHQFISKSKLLDFIIQGNSFNRDNFFILGINSSGKKILKFNSYEHYTNKSIYWKEEEFFSLESEDVSYIISNTILNDINLYPVNDNKQFLFISATNVFSNQSIIIKITIVNQKMESWILIEMQKKINILGAFDMDKDNLIDVLYIDENKNIYCLLNNDPYYYKVYLSTISSIYDYEQLPRIYISDNNNDGYPDIVTGDNKDNSVGLLFNPGKDFWNNVKNYFLKRSYDSSELIYRDKSWTYIPLYDIYHYGLYNQRLVDFSVIPTYHPVHKRINFELFTVYESGIHWFIEDNLNITSSVIQNSNSQPKNFIYCMIKSDIVIDKSKDITRNSHYKLIIDLDINNDSQPEFILYFENSLYLIKKYTPYLTGFGWDSSFWIYVCLYIFIVCSILGLWEFFKLNTLHNKISKEKLLRQESISKLEGAKSKEMENKNRI